MPQVSEPEGLIERVFPLRIDVDDRRCQNTGKCRLVNTLMLELTGNRSGTRKSGLPYAKENQIRWTKDLGSLGCQLNSRKKGPVHG